MNSISFPKLGIYLNINPVAFSLGSKPIYWYALIILTGFLLGLAFCFFSAKKRGIKPDYIYDIALYGLVVGVIFARIYYVIFDFDSFKDNLWDIFKIWEGGLAIYGGIIGGIITCFLYCKLKKLNTLEIFDICSPGLLIGQAIGRYGNFVNAEVYGRETSLPWGMSINGSACVHPLFLYESFWNILGFILIVIFRDKKTAHGQIFFLYLLWYSIGRLYLEGLRQNEFILYLIEGKIAVSQFVAAILIIFSIICFLRISKRKK